jgi:methionine-rich copper-binding protein CopC
MSFAHLLDRAAKATSLALAAAALAMLMPAGTALAHAFLDHSSPSAASALPAPPTHVDAHFDNPIDPAHSKLHVLDQNGADVTAGPPAAGDGNRSLSVPLKPLAPGQYFVKWTAVSADGDRTMGAFSFSVRGGSR